MAASFIITAATVLSTLSNVAGSQSDSPYYYNANFQDGKVSEVTVLNNDGKYLSNKLNYQYTYDDNARLVEKKTLKWNNDKKEWSEYQVQKFDYADNKIVTTMSRWNEETQSFELQERYEYTNLADNAVALTKVKYDNGNKDMASTEQIVLLNPTNDLAHALFLLG